MIPFDVDQSGWGSSEIYLDGALSGGYDPRYIVVHWGGLTAERVTDDLAFATLRGWQQFHLSKGWQDIAYQWAVTEQGTICRLRGHNHGGHTSGTDPVTGLLWGTVGVGVVWVGGSSDTDGPSDAALASMARIVNSAGLPVLGHQQTGKATACPGPDWLQWIDNEEWLGGDDVEFWIAILQRQPDEFWPMLQQKTGSPGGDPLYWSQSGTSSGAKASDAEWLSAVEELSAAALEAGVLSEGPPGPEGPQGPQGPAGEYTVVVKGEIVDQ